MENITTLPVVAPVEPKITKNETLFEWNYDAIEQFLQSATERYSNLVVTDDNLKDMTKAKQEIVSLRTSLQKFERATKKQLKKPTDEFSAQCQKLFGIIASVEAPLAEQLQRYDDKRIEELTGQIKRELQAKAAAMGVREEYLEQTVFNPKWTNKTAKWSETVVEIDHEVVRLKSLQQADDDREQLRKDRLEMVTSYVEMANMKYGLKTPLKADDFMNDHMLELGLADIKAEIFASAEEREAVERAAAQQPAPSHAFTATAAPVDELPPLPLLPSDGDYKDMIITLKHVRMTDYERICAALDVFEYPYDVELR